MLLEILPHIISSVSLTAVAGLAWQLIRRSNELAAWRATVDSRLDAGEAAFDRHKTTDCKHGEALDRVNNTLTEIKIMLGRMDQRMQTLEGNSK